jgi:hypothetical protein
MSGTSDGLAERTGMCYMIAPGKARQTGPAEVELREPEYSQRAGLTPFCACRWLARVSRVGYA